jgi:hypothetical protein
MKKDAKDGVETSSNFHPPKTSFTSSYFGSDF